MKRHLRRRAAKVVISSKKMTPAEFEALPTGCAWGGCTQSFDGDMPGGWVWLLAYWSRRPKLQPVIAPDTKLMRDAARCPTHARTLDQLLTPIARADDLGTPYLLSDAAGSA